jgi:uncharacterized protein (DUF2141 family)
MKAILPFIMILALYSGEIALTIKGIENQNGHIAVGLYKSPQGFRTPSYAIRGVNLTPKGDQLTYTFTHIPNGIYAISIFHDENRNGKLDENFVGLPKEGYGFSNNVRPIYRGATFEESKFELKDQTSLTINIGY